VASSTLVSVSCQVSAKFATCTVMGLNGTLVEVYMITCIHRGKDAFYLQ
jgi:hypothetical protein